MHRPRSPRIAAALKAGAWLMLFAGGLLCVATCTLAYAILTNDRPLFLPSLSGLIIGILLLLVYRIVANSARCSLCASPVLLSSRAQKNRHAKPPLFGSHRLRVAKDIAFTGMYRCPYCGEDTVCIPKEHIRQH